MTDLEKMAADIAQKMNGGEWNDGKWYSEEDKNSWMNAVKPYFEKIERFQKALKEIKELNWYSEVFSGRIAYDALEEEN